MISSLQLPKDSYNHQPAMIRFYAPDIETTLQLPESDSQHCVRVLRRRPGDMIEVIDGKGHEFLCRLLDDHTKHTAIEIVEKRVESLPWSCHITVAVAPTKLMDRMEWLVEKLTEIGVNRIIPLLCEHSERKEIKVERLEKIAVSAMKQSLKATLPEITPITPLKSFVSSLAADDSGQRFVAYCDKNLPRVLLAKAYRPGADVTILIGPEGDFSPREITAVMDAGFVPVTLGDCRLRTETAALVACDTVHIINQLNS